MFLTAKLNLLSGMAGETESGLTTTGMEQYSKEHTGKNERSSAANI